MSHRHHLSVFMMALLAGPAAAQQAPAAKPAHDSGGAHAHAAHAAAPARDTAADTAFVRLQERGKVAMGVDQYTSRHVFESLPDGGRIELQRMESDSAGTATIRMHLQEIARAFGGGDFSTPAFVHWREVPGAPTMAALHSGITYRYRDLPNGGELRIASDDPRAVQAIHEFLAFQNSDHRTGH